MQSDPRARALELVPAIKEAADRGSAERDIPSELFEAVREAELFRMFQPARFGGFEADPRTFYQVQNTIAEADASMGWVYGVLSIQTFILALFDERAQADVWETDGRALACSAFQAQGTAEPVAGGYRLAGHWSFSSGSSHAQWAIVGAKVEGEEPLPGLPPRLFLVPRAEYELFDTWHTFGLRGTGSGDLEVADAFVPAHRTHALGPGIQILSVADRPGPPLFRLPWLYMFTSSISNFAIGVARAALAVFLDINAVRVAGFTGKVAKEDSAVHEVAARMRVAIDEVEAMFDRHVESFLRHAAEDVPVPAEGPWLYRAGLTSAQRRLAAICDEMMVLLGGRGIFESSPFTRIWLDMMAARGHIGNTPAGAFSMLGKSLLEAVPSASDSQLVGR